MSEFGFSGPMELATYVRFAERLSALDAVRSAEKSHGMPAKPLVRAEAQERH